MDQASAHEEHGGATPIFGAYRRGYDPDQVDRYVADQQRRLDDATQRASEAERKLAAAVGQLRELHRRVAVLESENRSPQAPPLDSLGERVQRILQEAWEGAYALRQSTEQEMAELRERTAGESEAIIMTARQRARAIEEEIDRRRTAYIEQLEGEKNRAAAEIQHIHRERDVAIGELLKVKTIIETTVSDLAHGQPIRETELIEELIVGDTLPGESAPRREPATQAPRRSTPRRPARPEPVARREASVDEAPEDAAAELVRAQREIETPQERPGARRAPLDTVQANAKVFDFEEADDL